MIEYIGYIVNCYLYKNNRFIWVDVRWGILRRRVFMFLGFYFNLDSWLIILCM